MIEDWMEDESFFPVLLQHAASEDPLLRRVADLVAAKGVDPSTVVLAEFFQDDNSFYFGLLATPVGQVIQFGYDYLHTAPTEGALSEWNDLTRTWRESPYSEQVEPALKMVRAAP
jgi:hypothetical protein